MNIEDLDEGDILKGVLLETFRTKGVGSRRGKKIKVRLAAELLVKGCLLLESKMAIVMGRWLTICL